MTFTLFCFVVLAIIAVFMYVFLDMDAWLVATIVAYGVMFVLIISTIIIDYNVRITCVRHGWPSHKTDYFGGYHVCIARTEQSDVVVPLDKVYQR